MKFVMHLSKNGRLTAQKKKKYNYKYSRSQQEGRLSSIIQAQSIRINLTEIKTLIGKGIKLGFKNGEKKRKKTGHQIEAIIQEAEAEVKLEIVTTDEINVKALKGLHLHQKITKTDAQEVKPRIIVKNMIKRKETFSQKVRQLYKILKPS